MPDLALTDRLQPVLLDRLIDDQPGKSDESRERRVMNMSQIRQAILRDLEYLLNTPARPEGDPIYDYPLASTSVLNFGTATFSGRTTSDQARERLRAGVERAIGVFEPRLQPGTVRVKRVERTEEASGLVAVGFEVSGDIHPLPMPDNLFVRTEIDLELNQWKMEGGAS
jgi:type VI secretion system protein ImpF